MPEPQLVTPLEKLEKLSPFEGRSVVAVGIEVPSAGGGLRDALTIDPREFHFDERVFLVLETTVTKIRHEPVKGTDAWRRVHVVDVESAAIVEPETVQGLLEEQARRIEEERGIRRLAYDDELQAAHDRGDHSTGIVEGCPGCDEELAAADREDQERAAAEQDQEPGE